jgi:cytochrome c biogenesis protein CcmG/thiol:disulfide interchange protein DsbE
MIGPHTRRALLLLASVAVAVLWLNSITNSSKIKVGHELGEVQVELSDGTRFRLAEHRGEVVVLSFWATWCVPCRHEAPVLSRLHRAGVTVLGLAIDALPLATVGDKARAMGIDYPVGKGAEGLTERLGVHMVPTICVVGRDGKVSMVQSGMTSYDELHAAVTKAGQP